MFSIFKTFFLLGWVSFGGPAAHIGYFRNTFVEKLKWLSEAEYAQIVALSQFLPGPGSSQVGFALGYRKGGITGAIAAFLGFTLPSVILMLLLAVLSSQLTDSSVFQSIIHGLKLLAVVVVADATIGMYKNFCQQKVTIALCVATAMALLLFPNLYTQMIVLVVAALVGQALLRGDQANTESREPTQIRWLPLLLFAALLFGLPVLGRLATEIQLFSDFYQAGSLVFGGGHVVLPLLQNIVGDQLSQDAFLTGYAAAQAVPGPMFTFATYIGYELLPASPILGALLATLAVFLPGFLLLLAVLNNWQELASRPKLSGAVAGVNASVVGLLLAALYQPVFISAVLSGADMAVVVAGFYLLKQRKLPIVALVAFFIGAGMLLGML
ncbi:chromate resistance protein-related protein [Vibrio nigripulchritudo ATCC 27043]|uniref:chromate efflux transporter n=1 Tax=Vibrio nigripulchritudo TaxID=28173 RepID=UPI00021C2A96|nr:chromate efflux transporter [Vibrio nigripulchritudo]EGU55158.1 chromate resistance protein-related protein [Vibrio nigripulchritudo ATCC 27043]CCN33833.1 putative Chromate transport protein ChrA [Vibrio nigripulchritudo AM115]CCN41001.1 putative Chromate transport protein ChrA [Vibrio nigripulchritudo FTn2]CCN67826.1 putative Chromate transport protein ChrA [Vibrio nigripulchritudo POn4]CCN79403.1 putative Chromate transport protein ChrA [Vibrio nigripulchritudo SO65]